MFLSSVLVKLTAPRLCFALLLFAIAGKSVSACSCIGPANPKEGLAQAKSVFVGAVVSAHDDDFSFKVERVWKGVSGERIVVRDYYAGTSCEFNFKVGARYVVFATTVENDGKTILVGEVCNWTSKFPQGSSVVKQLGPGKPVTGNKRHRQHRSLYLAAKQNKSLAVGEKCGRFPETDFRKSGAPEFHRTYRNHAFGYRVRLPPDVTAYGESFDQPAHGVGIILSWEPRAYLYLDGTGNAMLLTDVSAAADLTERIVRSESASVGNVSRNWTWLGKHKALRMRIDHACGSKDFVTDDIFLLTRNIIYTISLTTPAARDEADKQVLDAIARSFVLTRLQ